MLIAYESLFLLPRDPNGEKTDLTACAAGSIMLTMSTEDFRVEHKDGKASVLLSRHVTNEQARKLGQALIDQADLLDEQAKKWQVITQSPANSVIQLDVKVP